MADVAQPVGEQSLIRIIANAILMMSPGRDPVCEYLIEAVDWYVSRAAADAKPPEPDPQQPEDAFEAWLVERWLGEIRSEAFGASAQGQYLRAEWERE